MDAVFIGIPVIGLGGLHLPIQNHRGEDAATSLPCYKMPMDTESPEAGGESNVPVRPGRRVMDILFTVSHDWLPLNFERRIFGRDESFYSLTLHFGDHAGKEGIHHLTVLAISEVPGLVRGRPGRPVPCADFR